MKKRNLIAYILLALIALASFSACQTAPPKPLEVGDAAPRFQAQDQDGNLWKSKDHMGEKYLVVYFYPAAMTGGCTKQACAFRDDRTALEDANVEVVGVSGDPVSNLKIFQKSYDLNFTLLSDETGEIAEKFNVPTKDGGTIEREFEGKSVQMTRALTTARWTFIIDPKGKVISKNTSVDAKNDSQNILDSLK